MGTSRSAQSFSWSATKHSIQDQARQSDGRHSSPTDPPRPKTHTLWGGAPRNRGSQVRTFLFPTPSPSAQFAASSTQLLLLYHPTLCPHASLLRPDQRPGLRALRRPAPLPRHGHIHSQAQVHERGRLWACPPLCPTAERSRAACADASHLALAPDRRWRRGANCGLAGRQF